MTCIFFGISRYVIMRVIQRGGTAVVVEHVDESVSSLWSQYFTLNAKTKRGMTAAGLMRARIEGELFLMQKMPKDNLTAAIEAVVQDLEMWRAVLESRRA